MDEKRIIETLSGYFEISRNDNSRIIDLTISEGNSILAYAVIKRKSLRGLEVSKDELSLIMDFGERVANQHPIILITNIESEQQIYFAVLAYWDFERYFYCKNLIWKRVNQKNVGLFRCFAKARRGNLRFLPNQMFRIEKIISLSASSLFDGEIRYFRTFRDGYRMKKTEMQSSSDQVDRLIYGTPENAYPRDRLDDMILKAVQEAYPGATMKSNLILFETDLLDLARLKDRKIKREIVYAQNNDLNILVPITDIEILYTPNIWAKTEPIRNIMLKIDCKDEKGVNDVLRELKSVYEPFSVMSI